MKKNPLNISRVPTDLTFVLSKRNTQSGYPHHLPVHVHVMKKGQSEYFISRNRDTRKTAPYIRNAYFSHKLRTYSAVKILKDLQHRLANFFCKGPGRQIFQAFWTIAPLSQLLNCCYSLEATTDNKEMDELGCVPTRLYL